MTPLDRLAAVLARMTEGPWEAHPEDEREDASVGYKHFIRKNGERDWYRAATCHNGDDDAVGIAALRNVADALIAVADAAKAMRYWTNEPCLRCDTDSSGATCTCTDHLERLKQAERHTDLALTALNTAIVKALGEGT